MRGTTPETIVVQFGDVIWRMLDKQSLCAQGYENNPSFQSSDLTIPLSHNKVCILLDCIAIDVSRKTLHLM